ncbi:MAG: preprotein translocase subunit YajC [Sedimenticola sp.]|jgi:preprotein translocase subunit YajC|nr:MAG: preprotein translocase subunit YajC [Sedimenticola sp.]
MSFFISDAMAQAAGGSQMGGMEGLILPVGLIIMLYFLMIRPQMKRQKEHKKMVDALAKGDEVQTEGGMMGRIIEIGDNLVTLEIAEGVQVKFRRASVATVLPKGTLKEL